MIKNLVSTIIPVFNRPKMVRKAVDSVLNQKYRPIEIILVNDGSTDETGQVLELMAKNYPDIIKVIHKVNGGPGLAREVGRLTARGEFIQYLDSDDWLLPEKFERQVRALVKNPECGIAYGVSRLVDQDGKIIKEPSKWTGRRYDYLFPALLIDRWWHTHTPLYRRIVSDAAGAWPKQRPEDWDLEARMGALKTKLVYCDAIVSCHCDHLSEGRVSQGELDAYLRDEAWFLPRLYQCSLAAGVKHDAPEMQHFSRWAFMRARHLAALGEEDAAMNLMKLSEESALNIDKGMRLFRFSANIIGWKRTGCVSVWRDKILNYSSVISSKRVFE